MSKNNVRIAIRDSTDSNNVAFFDNQAGIKYKSANLQRFLAGSASILTIKYNSKDIDSIRSGCKLAFRYKNRDYWLNVMNFEKKGFEVELTAYSLGLELNNETRGEHKPANAMSIAEYVAYYDPEHALTIGVNEVSDKRIKLEWTGTDTILARLFSVANSFGAELDFSVELNDDYSLKRQVLNIYKKGNLGTNKVSQPVRVGKELKVINYSDNIKELRTAVRATGKDGLTIDGLNKKIYDSNKQLLYYSSGMTVYAPQSRDRFPSVGKGSNDNWIVEDLGETQYETKEALWGYMYGEIQKKSLPEITYEVEGAIEAGIGDTQTLIDDIHFEPALYVQARVSELEDDILTGKVTKSTFINFERKYSQIADILLKQVEALAEDAAPYIIRLSTNNGYIFKNGEGSSTITARLEKYSKDIAATWKWVVDNKVVGTGDKLTVKAEQVTNTMAVTVIAYVNGNEVVRDYMTFSNSDDGVGVESIDRYFTSSDQSDGVTIEGTEWSDKPPAPTENGKYLWAYDEITYTDGTVTTTKPAAVGANFDVDAFRAEIAEDLKDVPNREEFENKIAEELANSKAEIETQIETAKTQAESNAKEYTDTINQETAKVAELANAAADEIKADLVNVKNNLTSTSLVANNAQAAVDEAKQDLTAVNTKVDNAKAEIDKAKQDLTNVASELNTAKQDLADSVTAVNTKVDSTKAELTQAKQQLTTVSDDLSKAKTDLQNAVSAVDTKATNLKSDLAQAKQDLTSQAQQLQAQASAQSELTKRVSSVEKTANGTKTTVSELSKTVAQNGKDITSVTNRTKTVEDDLLGTKTTLSQVKTTADSTSQKTATLESGLNGLSAKFDSLKFGGANLLLYSADPSKAPSGYYDFTNAQKTNETYNGSVVYRVRSVWGGLRVNLGNLVDRGLLKVGDVLTYSVAMRAEQAKPIQARLFIRYTNQSSAESPTDKIELVNLTADWQYVSVTFTVTAKMLAENTKVTFLGWELTSNAESGKYVYYACNKVERGNVATDYSPNEADLEQKVAEYKQSADQNYASLQTTVQNLDGTVQHNKTVADQTAQGFKTRIESLETYKNGESERANAYFESAKTETAKQLTAERTAIAKDYVAKSTYTSDVTGIRNDLTATTTTANTTKTNLANYQASNDKVVASLKSSLQTTDGNVSNLQTKVEAVPGQITSAVSAVEGKIPTSVGGRNYLHGTSNEYQTYTSTDYILGYPSTYRDWNKLLDPLRGKTVTLRAYIKNDTNHPVRIQMWFTAGGVYGNAIPAHSEGWSVGTGKMSTDWASANVAFTQSGTNPTGGTIKAKEAKLEIGNIPSDWSPAPEDAISQISNLSSQIQQTADGMTLLATKTELNTAKSDLQSGITTATNKANTAQNTANNNAQTISTHTTQISALNTGLSAKVSQTDFNTLSGRVTTAENNITAKANELSSKISSVEGKIPTTVGGRNYLRGTSDKYQTYTNTDYILGYPSTDRDWPKLLDPLRGKTVTLRAYIKNDTDYPVRIQMWFTAGGVYGNAIPAHSEGWSVGTGKMSANWTSANVAFAQTDSTATGGTIQAKEAKLEIGNIPSDWSPAPEDAQSDITKLSSEIKQTADGMTLLATKTELNSAKTDLQSGINTATNTANSAQNKANSNAQTINTHTTQISALNTGLQAKVSQSDFNTLSGRVTTAENNITAKANELSSKITSVEGKIPTEIGGKNLIIKSTAKTGVRLSADGRELKDQAHSLSDWIKIEPSTTYTLTTYENVNEANVWYSLAWYSTNNNDYSGFISRPTGTLSAADLKRGKQYQAPANAKYAKVSYPTKYAKVKFERGNIATDYTPAPEDTAEQISSLSSQIKQTADGMTLLATKTELSTAKSELQSGINTATNKANSAQSTANSNAQTISTHTTQISALNTGLSAKVSQSDFNTLSGRVTTAENNITAKANELSSKITSVEGKIPTEIGSSNLLRKTAVNTENLKLFGKTDTTISVVGKDGHQVYKLVVSGSSNAGAYFSGNDNYYNLVKDRNYTFSFWVLANKDKNFNMSSLGHIQAVNNNSDKVGNDPAHQHTSPVYSTSVVKANTWTKVWCTFKATSNSFFRPYFWYLKAGDEIYIYDMMLNEGKVPLSYTPAPEDTISQINSLSSELKQTKDGITLLATKTELNTAKNDLQSGINTATNKANAAQNTANNAQSTANSAQNKANSNAQTISTHTTQISALNTGLNAKVSQTDFNTLSGRVTSAENNITAKANELSSKISSVEGKIPTAIGSTNLLLYSADPWKAPSDYYQFNGVTKTDNTLNGSVVYKTNTAWNSLRSNWGKHLIDRKNVKVGDEFTYSIYAKTDQTSIRTRLFIRFSGQSNAEALSSEIALTNEWKKLSVTFKVTQKMVASQTKLSWVGFEQTSNSENGKFVYYACNKLERGNIATDYSPAPEDYDSKLAAAQSEFKQTTDSIKASVTSLDKSTVKSSSLTINSDGIVMKAGKSTTDVANAIGSYFSVNQNAINLFSDKINVKGNMIVSGAITSDKIASKSINTAHLNGKIITADVISSNAVTADAIKAGAVTTDKMAANSINGDRIAAGTLDAAKIKAGSISASQIASGTLTSAQIKAGAIKSINIEASAITSDKIASNSIDASKIVTNGLTANIIKGGVLQSVNGSTNFELNTGKLFYNNNNTGVFRVQDGASTMGLKFSNTSLTVSGTSRILSRIILGGDRRETTLDDGKWDKGGFSGLVIETIKGVEPATNEHADALRAISDTIYFTHTYSADSPTGISAHGWKMETYAPNSSYSGNIVLKPYGINSRQSDIVVGDIRLDNGDGSGYWMRATINTLKACFGHILNGGISSQALNAIRSELNKISGT